MVELARDALATFLHVSDLHVGPRNPSKPLPGLTPALANRFPGFLGHSGAALGDLERFVDDLTDLGLERGFELVVTGDVTACGADDQFGLANDYLGDEIGPTQPGLHQLAWKDLAIPGNHDHWPGSTWIFGPPAALGAHLQGCPIVADPRPAAARRPRRTRFPPRSCCAGSFRTSRSIPTRCSSTRSSRRATRASGAWRR